MNNVAVHPLDEAPFPNLILADNLPDKPEAIRRRADTSPTSALESLPQLSSQITRLWNTRSLNTFIHHVLLDTRDGKRQGFPREVAKELLFLAKLNVLTRAHEAAPLLGLSVAETCRLVEKGDHAALGYSGMAVDVWDMFGQSRRTRNENVTTINNHQLGHLSHSLPDGAKSIIPSKISLVLEEAPKLPDSACLDLTTSRTLRHDKHAPRHHHSEVMDQGFYRCIAKELSNLRIPQLVLSDLGNAKRCNWLATAVNFAKKRCDFAKVVLLADPLTADEGHLTLAMTAGLDQLVITLNLASGKWRAKGESIIHSDPEYFRHIIRRLIRNRDAIATKTGHRCTISVTQIDHKSIYHLSKAFANLANVPGIEPYHHVSESKRDENMGNCHCWSPFIEAHIRTNGHLVACAQDHSGYSYTADLKQTTFAEAWHGQIFRDLRKRVMRGDKPGRLCEICPHRPARKPVKAA
jgi:hypothetical protein